MAITKLVFLIVLGIAQHISTTPPNARPPAEQLREQRGSERVVPYFNASIKLAVWTWAVFHGLVLWTLSGYCPPAIAHPVLRVLLGSSTSLTSDPALAMLAKLTASFVIGTFLTLAGALLRWSCFHTLGHRFTFELAIRPTHMLVTHGVYAIVRHPSYTGAILVVVGSLMCVLEPTGWTVGVCVAVVRGLHARIGIVREVVNGIGVPSAGEDTIVTACLACVWTVALAFWYVALNERMNKEDAMLERTFGDGWRAWAQRVPYRLVPGLC